LWRKPKTGQIAWRYIFPLAVFWKGCFLANLYIVWYPIGSPEAIMGQNPDWGCAGKFGVFDHAEISEVLSTGF